MPGFLRRAGILRWGPALVLAALVGGFLVAILQANGRFTYTLDDPYIHLALAESIRGGTYGINPGEPASPASSILWPLLLVPVIQMPWAELWPLFLTTLSAFASLEVFRRLLQLGGDTYGDGQPLPTLLLLLLIPSANLVGLVFTGMEHSLHQVLTALAALGLIRVTRGELPRWLGPVLVLGPLVRFEGLAVSVPALFFLAWRGHRRVAAAIGVAVAASLGTFVEFLLSLGLEPLPASVATKSSLIWRGLGAGTVYDNWKLNLEAVHGLSLALVGILLILAGSGGWSRPLAERQLALTVAGSCGLHLAFGRFGWYYRYEVYAWTFAVLVVLFLFRDTLATRVRSRGLLPVALVLIALTAFSCLGYWRALSTTVPAATNVYEQQYQIHRFVTEHWRAGVAVNDIGWVAFRNPYEVLDLFGLASTEVLKARRSGGLAWMEELVLEHDIDCAMLFERWYPKLPKSWIKVGELHLRGRQVTAAFDRVAIFATRPAAVQPLTERLVTWQRELPDPQMLTLTPLSAPTPAPSSGP